MTDKPAKAAPQERIAIEFRDVPHAPIVYFDAAPNFGNREGIINVSLVAVRHIASSDNATPTRDAVVVADLRCSQSAAQSLRKALDDALLLGIKMEGQAN